METMVNIFWFRRDLRLSDNRGLFHALRGKYPVLPIFIFDTDILDDLKEKADPRVTFIYDSVSAIDTHLRNSGSYLKVCHGKPLEVFKDLASRYHIEEVFTNKDYEPYAKKRDQEVSSFLKSKNIGFHSFKDHVIFEGTEISKGDSTPYRVYTPYKSKWIYNLSDKDLEEIPSSELIGHFLKGDHERIPGLERFGFIRSSLAIPRAEIDEHLLADYDKTRDFRQHRAHQNWAST